MTRCQRKMGRKQMEGAKKSEQATNIGGKLEWRRRERVQARGREKMKRDRKTTRHR